ncbi:MAG TPA: hypothetical protein GXZ47_07035 [Treponema sp.]|nr:hypothetical protein [Treponema sp.]
MNNSFFLTRALLISLSFLLVTSCASLQKDVMASTADEESSGDIATLAQVIVPIDKNGSQKDIDKARSMIRLLEQRDIKDTSFETRLLAWSGRLYLLEGKRQEATRALKRAKSLASGETAVSILESRLETNAETRLAILDIYRTLSDIPAVIEIERARALEELRRYQEAVAAYDTAFAHLPNYYRETYGPSRNRSWEMRSLSSNHTSSTDSIAEKAEISLQDAITLIQDETDLFTFITGSSPWSPDRLYKDLNNRGIIPKDAVGTVRPSDAMTRAHVAWLLWQLNAAYRSQPALTSRYSDRMRTLANPKSPITDVPHGSRWFDSVMGCVEREIMNLPDGRNFQPNGKVSGVNFLVMIKALLR